MASPVSLRFPDEHVAERLRAQAEASGTSASALAVQLIDEGLKTLRHPLITFRGGPMGRRACLVAGPDVWEVVGGIVGGDVPPAHRLDRAAEVFGLRRDQLEAVMAYYAEFTEEIDQRMRDNLTAAEEAEALWRRRQDLLTR